MALKGLFENLTEELKAKSALVNANKPKPKPTPVKKTDAELAEEARLKKEATAARKKKEAEISAQKEQALKEKRLNSPEYKQAMANSQLTAAELEAMTNRTPEQQRLYDNKFAGEKKLALNNLAVLEKEGKNPEQLAALKRQIAEAKTISSLEAATGSISNQYIKNDPTRANSVYSSDPNSGYQQYTAEQKRIYEEAQRAKAEAAQRAKAEEARRVQSEAEARAAEKQKFYNNPEYQKNDPVGTRYRLDSGEIIEKGDSGWKNIGAPKAAVVEPPKAVPTYTNFYDNPEYQKNDPVGTKYSLPNGELIEKGDSGWKNIGARPVSTPKEQAPVPEYTNFYDNPEYQKNDPVGTKYMLADKTVIEKGESGWKNTGAYTPPTSNDFYKDPNYQKNDPVGTKYSLPNGELIEKGESGWKNIGAVKSETEMQKTNLVGKTIQLPDGTTAVVRSVVSSTPNEKYPANKFGAFLYTDKGGFQFYTDDFAKNNQKIDDTFYTSPFFEKNAKSAQPVDFGDFKVGTANSSKGVLLPVADPSKHYAFNSFKVESADHLEKDSPLLGSRVALPDGSLTSIYFVEQGSTDAKARGRGLNLYTTNGNYRYFDEDHLNGVGNSGKDAIGSPWLQQNASKASVADFSGFGKDLGRGVGSRGVIAPFAEGETGKESTFTHYFVKDGIFGGGFLGDLANDLAALANNPLVQLGATAMGYGAVVAGYNAGNAVARGDWEGALKSFAVGQAGSLAGNLAGNAVGGVVSNSIVNNAIQGAVSGAAAGSVGALLTGGNLGEGIVKGLIGGTIGSVANQAAKAVTDSFKPIDPKQDVATPDFDTEDVPDVMGGGGGGDKNIPVFNLPLDTLTGGTGNTGISDKFFKPNPEPDITNLGGTFQSNVGLNTPTSPLLGGNGDGTGLVAPIYNPDGTTQGFQGSGGATTPDFQIAIGNPNSFVNNPLLTGTPMTSGGTVANPPSNTSGGLAGAAGGSLADIGSVDNLGSTQSGQPIGSTPTGTPTGTPSEPTPESNTKGIESVISDLFKQLLTGLIGSGGSSSNPLTQSPTQGGTGTNSMADYSGLLGNLLGQNQQINRIQDLAGQQEGKFNAVAGQVENKPFTPYNVTSSAGSTNVQGQNITNTLGANQQQLANVAGQAAGMFGDVNVPNAENIRNTALQGSQNLLQQAQGFNPQAAAQTEYDALQQLYKPQRERDQLALENRLRAQGRLGASDNPALRQLYEAQGQQDLQASIQSRNLGFERQQQLQNLSQGMFTQGSQAAQLPTQIQSQRAQIGQMGANASQLPFNTLNQQQQLANQLAATQATQGTALATKGSDIRQMGITGNAGLMSQAAQMQNSRDLAAIQGILGGGQGGGAMGGVGGLINQGVNAGSNVLGGLIKSGVGAIGDFFGINSGNASMPINNPANIPAFNLPKSVIDSMSDDDFLDLLISGGTYGTSEGE